MEVLKKVADKYNMVALLHEKPFAGINGSGKHFNWSIGDNSGANYFEPSKSPLKNISFLIAVSAVLFGVKKFGGILRASVADAGNDHRLGANEAPPAIMSVYLGEYVSSLLDSIEKAKTIDEKEVNEITLGVQNLPKVNKDYSDRNRTSPVAFTGNKFEFRALGSSSNPSEAGTVLNFIAAYGFNEIYNRIESKKGDADVKQKALEVVKEIISETKDIRFEKNGYSKDWHKEAEKRSLPNARNTPEALKLFLSQDAVNSLAKFNILNERELKSKVEIKLENYIRTKEIEYKYAIKIVNTLILPAILKQIDQLSKTAKNLGKLNLKSDIFVKEIKTLVELYEDISKYNSELDKFVTISHGQLAETAKEFASKGVEILDALRQKVDAAEDLVSDEFWPMTSYQKLLNTF
jgi:glutamine synthetase